MPVVAVAAIAAVAAAIASLLLFYATYYLVVLPLQKVTTGAPWPVSWILSTIGNAERAIIDWVGGWLSSAVYPIVELLWVRYEGHAQNAEQTAALGDSLVAAIDRVASSTATNLGTTASKLKGLDQRFGGYTGTVAGLAAGLTGAQQLLDYVHHVQVDQARQAAVAAAAATTAAEVAQEAAKREAAVTAEHQAAVTAVVSEQHARAAADAKLAQDAAAADTALRSAIAATEQELRDLENTRVRELEQTLTDVRTVDIPAVRAQEATDVATIEATIATQAARLDCLDPLCGSGFSGLIGQLLAGAELLALLELAGGAIHDPEGTARDVGGFVGGIVRDAEGLLSPVVGGL